jgi:hypothetical protein
LSPVVGEPDSAEIFEVAEILEGIEGDVDLAIDVVVALLHFRFEDADDGESDAVEADALAERIAAAEELGLGFRADDGDMGAILRRPDR